MRVFGPTQCTPAMVLLSLETPSALSATKPRVLDQWLINPREGAQRVFVSEHVKTELMAWMMCTRSDASHLGGVAGLYFAMSDAGAARVLVQGPVGSQARVTALREFVRRKHPALDVRDFAHGDVLRVGNRLTCHPVHLASSPLPPAAEGGCVWCHPRPASPAAASVASPAHAATCLMLNVDDGKCVVLVVDCCSDIEALRLPMHRVLVEPCPVHALRIVVHLASASTCASAAYRTWVDSLPSSVEEHVYAHTLRSSLASSDALLRENRQRLPRLFPQTESASREPVAVINLFAQPLCRTVVASSDVARGDAGANAQADIEIDSAELPTESCVVVLGSGAAKPSTLRGLSALHVWFDASRSALLDVGEATVWQMERAYGAANVQRAIDSLELVWVSHAHLDHHGGLLLVLQMRSVTGNPLTVVAPHAIGRLLAAACNGDDVNRYTFVPCGEAWSVPGLSSVPADHCPDAHSVAVDWTLDDGTPVRLVYSGDTRGRSPALARLKDSSRRIVLVHEATFEDALAEEARAKAHSTVADAARAALALGASALLLTHQSQRYAIKLPEADVARAVKALPGCAVLDAHDLMRVSVAAAVRGDL